MNNLNNAAVTMVDELLGQPEGIKELTKKVQQCVTDFDVRRAKILAKEIDAAIPSAAVDTQQVLLGLSTRLKILALPLFLEEQDILAPFKAGFGYMLQYEDAPEIIQRIKAKLLDFDPSDRNEWRQKILQALQQNTDIITTSSSAARALKNSSTVAEWMRSYNRYLGSSDGSDIKLAGFVYNSVETRTLSAADKSVLLKLLTVYEYLKLSSLSVLGVEEEIIFTEGGYVKDLNNGRPVPIVSLVPSSSGASRKVDIPSTSANESQKPIVSNEILMDKVAPPSVERSSDVIKKAEPPVIENKESIERHTVPNNEIKKSEGGQVIIQPSVATHVPDNVVGAVSQSVTDIRPSAQALGPIDELRLLRIDDFRKLHPDPVEAAKRVLQKIGLLEDESYDRKADAIRAWRQSPVHRLYLDVIDESVRTGVPITSLFEKHNLRKTEWEALGALSRDLSS